MDPATFTPADSPLTVVHVMGSPEYQDLFTPDVSAGEVAFDFVLPRLEASGEPVRLSQFAGRQPVALIFGSHT
jgi:hypothetical protein